MKLLIKSILLIAVIFFPFTTIAKNGFEQGHNSSQNIELNLSIAEYVALELPDSINMDVRVGEDKTVEAVFLLRANCSIDITFTSLGFKEENAEILNQYVEYGLDGYFSGKKASFKEETFKIAPGTYDQGIFSVNWLGKSFAEDEWQNVTTGDYQDTVTVTISY